MNLRVLSLLKSITSAERSPGTPDPSTYLPAWERRAGGRSTTETHVRVLWTGTQISSLPILIHEPPSPPRHRRSS